MGRVGRGLISMTKTRQLNQYVPIYDNIGRNMSELKMCVWVWVGGTTIVQNSRTSVQIFKKSQLVLCVYCICILCCFVLFGAGGMCTAMLGIGRGV